MIMVVQSYIEENFIKKNSTNPNKARKLIVSTDEAHRILKFEGARMFENALYRVARKTSYSPMADPPVRKGFCKVSGYGGNLKIHGDLYAVSS